MDVYRKKDGLKGWLTTDCEDGDILIYSTGIEHKLLNRYNSLSKLFDEWEDHTPAEPLIKDEKIRKAVRAWAEANGFSVFKVYNQHFNYVKIHGVKDRYNPNGSNIEFMGTIAGAEKRAYEIDELCGEEEE